MSVARASHPAEFAIAFDVAVQFRREHPHRMRLASRKAASTVKPART